MCIVYFTELTVVIPRVLRNEAGSVSVLLFEPGAFLFAVNVLSVLEDLRPRVLEIGALITVDEVRARMRILPF